MLVERHPKRHLLRWEGTAVLVGRCPDSRPFCRWHLARFFEPLAQQHLGRFVVEDESALIVDNEDRHREVARKLPDQDHFDLSLWHRCASLVVIVRRVADHAKRSELDRLCPAALAEY